MAMSIPPKNASQSRAATSDAITSPRKISAQEYSYVQKKGIRIESGSRLASKRCSLAFANTQFRCHRISTNTRAELKSAPMPSPTIPGSSPVTTGNRPPPKHRDWCRLLPRSSREAQTAAHRSSPLRCTLRRPRHANRGLGSASYPQASPGRAWQTDREIRCQAQHKGAHSSRCWLPTSAMASHSRRDRAPVGCLLFRLGK